MKADISTCEVTQLVSEIFELCIHSLTQGSGRFNRKKKKKKRYKTACLSAETASSWRRELSETTRVIRWPRLRRAEPSKMGWQFLDFTVFSQIEITTNFGASIPFPSSCHRSRQTFRNRPNQSQKDGVTVHLCVPNLRYHSSQTMDVNLTSRWTDKGSREERIVHCVQTVFICSC